MKNILLFTFILLVTMASFGQIQEDDKIESTQKRHLAVKYRLFPTQNMWTFIKLNTRNGKMWQVQFDVQENNRFETYLNLLPLASKEKEIDDRFTLYPTQNIHTFILLDQIDGRIWQTQWSMEPDYRGVLPID